MPRAGLNPTAVVDAALTVLDEAGVDGLTLAAVAAHAGVATPSLYKHVKGLGALRDLVGVRVLDELAARCEQAAMGRSADEALAAVLHAYRQYAREHPHRYAALPQQPADDPELVRAGDRAVSVFLAVLRGYGLAGADAIHVTRGLRAAAHGFVLLEIGGGFGLPEKLDDSYRILIDTLTAGLHELPMPI
ncbi:TetR family transcriptional regulator [Actinocatenispora thailandica]|uniref:TetR family transcriptional regulator n=1 Tax=Actinocatenispora thailandica TaxID=227318 RepID=A0A7R7I1F6_9ACTN|nr:TetR/AcrR family transcriptional regulator [Actinocatenispora thailandica]BCJ39008.1 TetR family transcriptional regulator [Actinocatenispora thailandica]